MGREMIIAIVLLIGIGVPLAVGLVYRHRSSKKRYQEVFNNHPAGRALPDRKRY